MSSLPFLGRRRYPVAVAVIVEPCRGVKAALGLDVYSGGAAVLVASYGLGEVTSAHRDPRRRPG